MAASSTPSTIGVPKHAHLEGLVRHACGGFFCSSIARAAGCLDGLCRSRAAVLLVNRRRNLVQRIHRPSRAGHESQSYRRSALCSHGPPAPTSLPPSGGDGWGSPRAPVGAAGKCWHCRRVQQFIRSVLGALPNFIGWLVAERQQHPTTSQGVSSRFGATGAKSCMMASAVSRRETGVANVLAGLKVQTKALTTLL